MTIETLKKLIDREFDRFDTIPEIREGVEYLLSVYEKELEPDYRKYIQPNFGNPLTIDCDKIPDKVPYGQICPCNPANGGSGICGCTMGNTMVDNPAKYGQPKTNLNTTTGTVCNSIHNFVEPELGNKDFCKMCGINKNHHMTISLT